MEPWAVFGTALAWGAAVVIVCLSVGAVVMTYGCIRAGLRELHDKLSGKVG